MDLPTLISRSGSFPFLGMLGGIFHVFYKFLKNVLQANIMRYLIRICTVCLCPIKSVTFDLLYLEIMCLVYKTE